MAAALDHARAIADAVLRAGRQRDRDATKDRPTQAVLLTMERRGVWFMVWDADAAAWTQLTRVPPAPRPPRGARS